MPSYLSLIFAYSTLLTACQGTATSPKDEEQVPVSEDTSCATSLFYIDADGDGFGDASEALEVCTQPEGAVLNASDCDDTDETIHPEGRESCNSKDDDCNGLIDDDAGELWFADADGDGFGNDLITQQLCEEASGWVSRGGDCDDGSSSDYPDAEEVCDETDNDCDGDVDEGVTTTWYADDDFDGFGDPNSPTEACSEPTGLVLIDGDCDDTTASVFPGAQDGCNAVDDDCDGTVDEDVKLGWSLVSIDTTTGYVYEIDPSTASTSSIAEIAPEISGINSMDVWENGTAIAHSNVGSVLFSFDVCQGTGAELGATGVSGMGGISFGSNNQLYGLNSSNNQLMLLDITGGAASLIGALGASIGNNGMAYDCSTNTLYGADAVGDQIFTVDPVTGAAGNFVSTTVPFLSVGLEFDHSTGLLLAATGSELWTIDPATGASTFVGNFGGPLIDDLAFYPSCP